jgi:hypothetical protein
LLEEKGSPVQGLGGVTKTERVLQRLCAGSFLRLWTYGNVYRNQAINAQNKQGKEICDALVVFRDRIIIFSDKECRLPDSQDVNLAWRRWYKRAILESRQQLLGAERWIRNYPDRVFLDDSCTEKISTLPTDWTRAKIYKVIIANGLSVKIQNYFGDSGSLMLNHEGALGGDQKSASEPDEPFVIKSSFSDADMFHVLDEWNLSTILTNLDTISDFVRYLDMREQFFRSGISFHAPGEEELLAYYLQHTDATGQHDFVFDTEYDAVAFESGLWADFEHGEHLRSARLANRQSYLWDQIIENVTHGLLEGTLRYPISEGRTHETKILEQLASENRFKRRILAKHLLEVMFRPNIDQGMFARTVRSESQEAAYYLFLAVTRSLDEDSEEHREFRSKLLFEYCRAVRNHYVDATDVFGIATELNSKDVRSWDLEYFDGSVFTKRDEQESTAFSDEFGIYRNFSVYHGYSYEYPSEGSESRGLIDNRKTKGRYRNRACPCRSGRKYKHCCGRPRVPSKLEWLDSTEV